MYKIGIYSRSTECALYMYFFRRRRRRLPRLVASSERRRFSYSFIIYFCGGTVTDKTDRLGGSLFFRLAPTFKSVQISFTFLCSTFVC